ncbi:MAG: hypothetical protein COW65_01415 [Cytophagales bacterium CG18_big_fil_WC_8_21_14_2_50_42_9]|nr:MAG: hypothetical protein COW65_01415 [Cytophagales bacterium CG18_big_fil_WC_8_21_14_2_50_42_9]
MKKLLGILAITSLLASCTESGIEIKKKADFISEANSQQIEKENSAKTSDVALDSSMTMEEAAKKILSGENYNRWNDTYLLSLIDSLNSNNKESRKYYFKVFNKIMDKADGYVSEAIGTSALKYTSNHTIEFIEWSRELTEKQLDSWAYHVGVEISLSSQSNDLGGDDMEYGKSYANLLRQNCKTCSIDKTRRLEEFTTSTLQTVKRVSE